MTGDKININPCEIQDLIKVSGIGRSTTKLIMAHMESIGEINREYFLYLKIHKVSSLVDYFDFSLSEKNIGNTTPEIGSPKMCSQPLTQSFFQPGISSSASMGQGSACVSSV